MKGLSRNSRPKRNACSEPSKPTKLLPPSKMYGDYPPGISAFLLNQLSIQMIEQGTASAQAYAIESDRLFNVMYHRNVQGIELEKAGEQDRAIAVYEQNIVEWFDGNHPYDRLRILYTQRKEYDNAIRVCQRFVEMADTLLRLGSPRTDLRPKRDKFAQWITRLYERQSKQ